MELQKSGWLLFAGIKNKGVTSLDESLFTFKVAKTIIK